MIPVQTSWRTPARPAIEWLAARRRFLAAEVHRPIAAAEVLAVWRVLYAVACLVRISGWQRLVPELQVRTLATA